MSKHLKLIDLKQGEAFKYENQTYIAIALTPDPYDVFCLNTITKAIEEIPEDEVVERIDNWYVGEGFNMPSVPNDKELEVLY